MTLALIILTGTLAFCIGYSIGHAYGWIEGERRALEQARVETIRKVGRARAHATGIGRAIGRSEAMGVPAPKQFQKTNQ